MFSMLRGLYSWFLDLFGLNNKSGRILFLGLDFAGKTTLLHLLKTGKFTASAPTQYGSSETLTVASGNGNEKLHFTATDLGGHTQVRRVWKDYFHGIDAVVFVVDAADRERLPDAAHELNGILSDEVLSESNVPVLILANKIDKPEALGEFELVQGLGIYDRLSGKTRDEDAALNRPRKVELFPCSLMKVTGYGAGLRWMARYL